MSKIFKFTPRPVDHNLSPHHSNTCDHAILPAHHANTCDHVEAHTVGSHSDDAKGADIASAATVTPGTDGNYYDLTGTTTVAALGIRDAGDKVEFRVISPGLTFTHSTGTLNLRNKFDITSEAGMMISFISEGSGEWTERWRWLSSAEGGDQGVEFTLTMQTGVCFFVQNTICATFSSGTAFTITPTLTMETGANFFTGVASTCNFACQCNC